MPITDYLSFVFILIDLRYFYVMLLSSKEMSCLLMVDLQLNSISLETAEPLQYNIIYNFKVHESSIFEYNFSATGKFRSIFSDRSFIL